MSYFECIYANTLQKLAPHATTHRTKNQEFLSFILSSDQIEIYINISLLNPRVDFHLDIIKSISLFTKNGSSRYTKLNVPSCKPFNTS